MLGQGVWVYENITTSPSFKFFRHINVHKGMGVVVTDAKYPNEGVVIGTFGNWYKMNQFGQEISKGSLNAGHGGEKVRARIASHKPRFGSQVGAADGIWHTAMNGFRGIGGGFYQNSARSKAGLGPVMWDSYAVYPSMGDDFHHPGVGIDLTDRNYAYISTVFGGNLCVNIWNGTKMVNNPGNLIVVAPAGFEVRHAPACAPAPGPQGGVFYFWSGNGVIKGAYVSKTGVVGPVKPIGNGRTVAATTDRDGHIHLAYYNNGLRYRKLTISNLRPIKPSGRIATRTPVFKWSDTGAARYTVKLLKDDKPFSTNTVAGLTFTPATPLGVGRYEWRVKEGNAGSPNTWSSALTFVVPPAKPQPVAPNGRFDTAVTPDFEWANDDPEATRYTIELYSGGSSLGTISVTGDVKNLQAAWPTELGAGFYSWRIRATRVLPGNTISSDWSAKDSIAAMPFQVLLPGPATITAPVAGTRIERGNQTLNVQWTPADGATAYALQLRLNGSKLDTFFNIVDTNFAMVRNFEPGHHFLMVRPQNGDGAGLWSEPVQFTVNRETVPADQARLAQPPARFEWTRSSQATRYRVRLLRFMGAKQTFVVKREAWITQPAAGTPSWRPTFNYPNGKYRLVVTDLNGSTEGMTSFTTFWVQRP